ncbi:MAG: hypothetical protein ACYDC4_10240 [Candidatus Dormibacteria bacterium]
MTPLRLTDDGSTVRGYPLRSFDVGVELRRTISRGEFTSAIATFGGMGVAVW